MAQDDVEPKSRELAAKCGVRLREHKPTFTDPVYWITVTFNETIGKVRYNSWGSVYKNLTAWAERNKVKEV
jgi:hypothetical protein